MSADLTYWATLPSSEFAGELKKRIDGYYDYVRKSGRLTLWKKMHSMTHAGALALGRTRTGGEQGELTFVGANHLGNILTHLVNQITSERPAFDAKATNTDYDSEVECQLAGSILDYDMRAKRLEQHARQAVRYAAEAGEGWGLKTWDTAGGEPWGVDPTTQQPILTGTLRYASFHPLDIVRDPFRDFDAPRTWLAVRRWESKYDLAAAVTKRAQQPTSSRPPEEVEGDLEAIAAAQRRSEVEQLHPLLSYDRQLDVHDEDDCEVFEFYHARTEAAPDGRRCLLIGDRVIEDGPLPYKQLPLFPVRGRPHEGTCFGYSPMFDLAPLQEGVDALVSTVASNQAAFGVQSILVPKGHGLDVQQLSRGLQAISYDPGLGPPVPLQLTKTAPETFTFLELLVQYMETLSGISSVVRGDPQASLKSGSALAMVASQSLQFTIDIQAAYVMFLEDITTAAIEDYKSFAKTPQVALIAGKSNFTRLKKWQGSDLANVSRIVVDVGNALSKTLAGRSEMAAQLVQAGLVTDPRTYVEVLTTGRLEAVTEPSTSELLLVKAENESISEYASSPEGQAEEQQRSALAQELAAAPPQPEMDPMTGQPAVDPMTGGPVAAPPPEPPPAWAPPVIDTDDHVLHLKGHKVLLASPASRENAALVASTLEHMRQHTDALRMVDPLLLQALGIPSAAPQPTAPPPGEEMPPGPPGSGDPTYVPPMPKMPQMPKNPGTGKRESAPRQAPQTPPGAQPAQA